MRWNGCHGTPGTDPEPLTFHFYPGTIRATLHPGKTMHAQQSQHCTAFLGHRQIACGSPRDVALACWRQQHESAANTSETLLVFDDASSLPVEFDLRGSAETVLARLQDEPPAPSRGPGRPKLGVTAREVTLLPRHWDWLAAQPGGASAALRRLVEQARRGGEDKDRARRAGEAVDRFMQAMTGDMPSHEEASRAFWRGEHTTFAALIAAWPDDVRDYLQRLANHYWADAAAV